MTVRTSVLWKIYTHMAKKWPGMVIQRTFIKGHSFVYRLYLGSIVLLQKMFYHNLALREQNPSSWAGNYPHLFHFANRIKWPLKKKMAHYCCTVCNLKDIKTVHLSMNSTLGNNSFLWNLHYLWFLFEH